MLGALKVVPREVEAKLIFGYYSFSILTFLRASTKAPPIHLPYQRYQRSSLPTTSVTDVGNLPNVGNVGNVGNVDN